MKKISYAYLAGFIDGEGCIRVSRRSIRIELVQRVPTPLKEIQREFGGRIRRTELIHHERIERLSIQYRLTWDAREDTHRILRGIRSYVILKKAQVEIALEFLKAGSRLTTDQVERRKQRLSQEKRRTPKLDLLRRTRYDQSRA